MHLDGPGLASSVVGLARRGRAIVEVFTNGLPLRAGFGPLPGRAQMVPRTGYSAAFKGLEVAAKLGHVISVHLSLVHAGQNWGMHHERSSSRHAAIWRRTHCLRPRGAPPKFQRTPARRSLERAPDDPFRNL